MSQDVCIKNIDLIIETCSQMKELMNVYYQICYQEWQDYLNVYTNMECTKENIRQYIFALENQIMALKGENVENKKSQLYNECEACKQCSKMLEEKTMYVGKDLKTALGSIADCQKDTNIITEKIIELMLRYKEGL